MSIRAYAAHLGVTVSTVTNWDSRAERARLRTETQQLLDIDLARASDDVRVRFEALLANAKRASEPPSHLGSAEALDGGRGGADSTNPSGDLGTTVRAEPIYSTVDDVLFAAAALWRVDIDRTAAVASLVPENSAWNDAALKWLTRSDPEERPEPSSTINVGAGDAAAVRATVAAFSGLDDIFGGAHARLAFVQYLNSDLLAALRGRYTDEVGRQLHSAGAEACLLAAWMTYDSGLHGLAQRYFMQALRLAQAASDVPLASSVLDAMSHQATFLGRHRDAANLARTAHTGSRGHVTSTMSAHFHVMEARALAAAGERAATERALSRAVSAYDRRNPDNDPPWFTYFDDAELSAEFSHCLRDIGRPADAITYAQRALSPSATWVRSDFFVTVVLAESHLATNDIEHACATATQALQLGRHLKSDRCVAYLRRFRGKLKMHARERAVRTLTETAEGHPLWTASASERTPTASAITASQVRDASA